MHASRYPEIRVAFLKLGLGDTTEKCADWMKLCMPRLRESVDWTTATLPAINPFFEVYFFGGKHSNLSVEQHFSTYGNHTEDQQSEALKEALTVGAIRLQPEKDARRSGELRKKPLEVAEGEEPPDDTRLKKDSDTRTQLQMRGQQLVSHLQRSADRPALGEFRKQRELAWLMLRTRELKVLSGKAVDLRAKGRAKRVSDPYGEQRSIIRGEAVQVEQCVLVRGACVVADCPPVYCRNMRTWTALQTALRWMSQRWQKSRSLTSSHCQNVESRQQSRRQLAQRKRPNRSPPQRSVRRLRLALRLKAVNPRLGRLQCPEMLVVQAPMVAPQSIGVARGEGGSGQSIPEFSCVVGAQASAQQRAQGGTAGGRGGSCF